MLPEWSAAVRLAAERETLGIFLSGHPIDEFRHDLQYLAPGRIAEVTPAKPGGGEGRWTAPRNLTLAGLVLEIRRRGNRTSLVLDDGTGRMEVSLFEDVLQQHRELIVKDAVLLVEGALRWDDFIEGWRLNAKTLTALAAAREERARRLLLRWPVGVEGGGLLGVLNSTLEPVRGGRCAVAIYYPGAAAHALLELGPEWSVRPTRAVLEELARHFGEDGVRLVYHPRDQQQFLTRWGARGEVEARPLR